MIVFFFLLLMLSHTPVYGQELVKVDSREFADSVFVRAMNIQNGGRVPYPFSKLLDSFNMGLTEDGQILAVPNGRSLVKNLASDLNPRLIVNVQSNSPLDPVSRNSESRLRVSDGLYLGFVPGSSSIEVISYNRATRRYDFLLVEDYAPGKSPRVVSEPSKCISCHQNGGPIFPNFPWREFGNVNEVRPQGVDEGKFFERSVFRKIRSANPGRTQIDGISLDLLARNQDPGFATLGSFDGSVRRANARIISAQVCDLLCSNRDTACKLKVLSGVFKGGQVADEFDLSKIESSVAELSVISSRIPDRNPETGNGLRFESRQLVGTSVVDGAESLAANFDPVFSETNIELKNEREVEDPGFADPSTPRPLDGELVLLRGQLKKAKTSQEKFSLVARQCLDLSQLEVAGSTRELETLPISDALTDTSVLASLENWPDLRDFHEQLVRFTEALEKSGPSLPLDCNQPIASTLPVYKIESLQIVSDRLRAQTIEPPLQSFQRYCIECHGTGGILELPLTSLQEMANYQPIMSSSNVIEKLEGRKMPPPGKTGPTDAERSAMIEALRALRGK